LAGDKYEILQIGRVMPDPDEKNDLLGVTEMKGLKKRFSTLLGIPLKNLKKGNG
jgi:hypothetical protein